MLLDYGGRSLEIGTDHRDVVPSLDSRGQVTVGVTIDGNYVNSISQIACRQLMRFERAQIETFAGEEIGYYGGHGVVGVFGGCCDRSIRQSLSLGRTIEEG